MANEQLPDSLRPADEIQTGHIARWLGTTAEKLCPGLKLVAIYRLLNEKDPGYFPLLAEIAQTANNYPIEVSQDGQHLRAGTVVLEEDVRDCWKKFLYGIQYGFEHGPEWDIPNRPRFLVGSSEEKLAKADSGALYVSSHNIIMMGAQYILGNILNKQAEKLTAKGDFYSIKYLEYKKRHGHEWKYPVEFHPLCHGLEEIRHAQQYNNATLHTRMQKEVAAAFPNGVPNRLRLPDQAAVTAFYEKYPIEMDANNFVESCYAGAVAHYSKTQKDLTEQDALGPPYFPLAGSSLIVTAGKAWTAQPRSRSNTPMPGGGPTKPEGFNKG
jgi:hypothetical protein